jgi:hypothetical protein
MAPVKVLNLLLANASELSVEIVLLPLLVVRNHPVEAGNRNSMGDCRCCKIETVADVVMKSITGQEQSG